MPETRPHPFEFGRLNFICCVCLKPMPPRPAKLELFPERKARLKPGMWVDIIVSLHNSCACEVGTQMSIRAAEEAQRQLAWEALVQLN